MKISLTRHRITLYTTIILLLLIGLFVARKYVFRATSSNQVYTANVIIDVNENGKEGLGTLQVVGNGVTNQIPSEEGSFNIVLNRSLPPGSTAKLYLYSVAYHSFLTNSTYNIPVTPQSDTGQVPVGITSGSTTHLVFNITTVSGKTTAKLLEYKNNVGVDITKTGIQ